MLRGRRGGDVIASLLAPCVTSAVNGEKEQPGSNNNHKKILMEGRYVFRRVTITQQWNQPCVAPQFSGTKRPFFMLCSTQSEYDLKP